MEDDEAVLFGVKAPTGPTVEFRIESALQGQQSLELVEAAVRAGDPYMLAFVDMRMPPGWDGVQTIKRLWQADPNLQIVICTAYSDYSWEEIAGELGPTDRMLILKKPFDDVEARQLAAALTQKWLATRSAEMKLVELESLVVARTAELRQTALQDRLTGLANRELLIDRLNQAMHQRRRDPAYRFALLFIDFDRFKVVNDSLGHDVGDALLMSIAERLRDSTRATDCLARTSVGEAAGMLPARLGGDEFLVLLDGLAAEVDAARVAERLLADLAAPHEIKGHLVHSTASIGVTSSFVNYDTAEAMIRDADTAMYRAKFAGKNRYVLFDQKMHDDAVARLTLENDLRRAVVEGQFVLYYQPIVSLSRGRIAGYEALIRWRRPDGSIVMPLEFIPLAEEIGVITEIGNWTMREACRQLAQWRGSHPERMEGVTMSVNLSRRQLSSPALVDQIRQAYGDAGLPADRLILEITENAIMQDAEGAVEVLKQIRGLGVELHMDDFGTGYSSLSCLHRFPISGLKIDRSFVQNVGERRDYAAVVNAIIALAQNLGMALVAEGVETTGQLAMLQSLGSELAQGFLFAKPLEAGKALEFAEHPTRLAFAA